MTPTTDTYRCAYCGWVGLTDRIPNPCTTWHLTVLTDRLIAKLETA